MSHIHLPDGVLPIWLWVSGYVATALLMTLLWRWKGREANVKRIALLGIFAALMLLVMAIEIPPYHANLSVVTAIILGPPLAIIAGFIVSLFLAFIGHGGITVVGLNTLVLAVEMLAGYGMFYFLRRIGFPLALAGFLGVVIGLGCGTAASFGIIAVAAPAINQSLQAPQHEEQPAHEHEENEPLEQASEGGQLDLRRLAVIMFGFGSIGWVLEGVISMVILTALNRVYPDFAIQRE